MTGCGPEPAISMYYQSSQVKRRHDGTLNRFQSRSTGPSTEHADQCLRIRGSRCVTSQTKCQPLGRVVHPDVSGRLKWWNSGVLKLLFLLCDNQFLTSSSSDQSISISSLIWCCFLSLSLSLSLSHSVSHSFSSSAAVTAVSSIKRSGTLSSSTSQDSHCLLQIARAKAAKSVGQRITAWTLDMTLWMRSGALVLSSRRLTTCPMGFKH